MARYAQPKGHRWVFSHEQYVPVGDRIQVVRFEKCVTPRHKHAMRKKTIRTMKK